MLEVIEGVSEEKRVPKEGWSDIGLGEEATLVRYCPAGWEEQSYVVIRRRRDRGQTLLLPVYAVILVSRDDLPLDELVRRHRGKQDKRMCSRDRWSTSEQHDPPCRRFRASQAFYICGQIAQMLLRAVQYRLLSTSARRHGLRPLIRNVVRVVGRLVRSGRRWWLDFACSLLYRDLIAENGLDSGVRTNWLGAPKQDVRQLLRGRAHKVTLRVECEFHGAISCGVWR